MLEGKSIDVYNYGKMKRDFTYIDDIVEAVVRMQDIIPQPNPEWTVENGFTKRIARRHTGCITSGIAHRLSSWILHHCSGRGSGDGGGEKYDADTARRCAGNQRRYQAAV